MKNIELKARLRDAEGAPAVAKKLRARHRGDLHQTDMYFNVRFGRLKLRELNGEPGGELIAYRRADEARSRVSDYEIVRIEDAPALKSALGRSLGVRAIVRKRRSLWLLKNVRIHLDKVDHLGAFIEFEAVMKPDATENDAVEAHREVARLARRFGVEPADIESVSYEDLLMRRNAAEQGEAVK